MIDRMEYEHPLYTPASVAASRRLPEINTDRVAFAGAYHGWGFHEDGARSGLAAATHLGLPWVRTTRVRRRSRAASGPRSATPGARPSRAPSSTARPSGWSTSTTCPTTAPLARFEARDHLGSPDAHAARTTSRRSSPSTASRSATASGPARS